MMKIDRLRSTGVVEAVAIDGGDEPRWATLPCRTRELSHDMQVRRAFEREVHETRTDGGRAKRIALEHQPAREYQESSAAQRAARPGTAHKALSGPANVTCPDSTSGALPRLRHRVRGQPALWDRDLAGATSRCRDADAGGDGARRLRPGQGAKILSRRRRIAAATAPAPHSLRSRFSMISLASAGRAKGKTRRRSRRISEARGQSWACRASV
jgi:hypothetical protein